MTDDDQPLSLDAKVTAQGALLVAILTVLGNRDRALALEIIDACPTYTPAATDISPDLAAVKIALNELLDELRRVYGRD